MQAECASPSPARPRIRCVNASDPYDPNDPPTDLHGYSSEGPDNIAFGKTGKLYVALALSNQVGVLDPSGTEVARYSGPAKGANGLVPWDAPAGIAFNNSTRSLLVTNHALVSGFVNPHLFVVFDAYASDRAAPLAHPVLPDVEEGA